MSQSPKFRLEVIHVQDWDRKFHPEFDQIFDLWRDSFKDNYDKWEKEFFSDGLYCQHEILALFDGPICITMVCHRYVNLKQKSLPFDSYFEFWPQEAKSELVSLGESAVLGSQIAIHPEYRGKKAGVNVKSLITALSLDHLSRQGLDVVVARLRSDKNMGQAFHELGARTLIPEYDYLGTPIEAVVFELQKRPIQLPSPMAQAIREFTKKGESYENRNNDGTRKAARKAA